MILPEKEAQSLIRSVIGSGRPLRRALGEFGDSKAAFSYSGGGNNVLAKCFGAATWTQSSSLGRVSLPRTLNKGVSGETTSQMLRRVNELFALPCDVWCVIGGSNDRRNNMTVSASARNMYDICYALLNAGKIPVVTSETPKSRSGPYALTQAQLEQHHEFHLWMKNELPRLLPEVIVNNPYEEMVDPKTLEPLPGMMQADLAHQSLIGAEVMGRHRWQAIRSLFPREPEFLKSEENWHNDVNVGGTLTASPLFLTTGGTINARVKPKAGSVIGAGWEATADAAIEGIQTEWWIEEGADVGNWQCLRVTGQVSTATAINMGTNLALANLTVGDRIKAMARVQTQGTGLSGPAFGFVVAAAQYYGMTDCELNGVMYPNPSRPFQGSRESPIYTHSNDTLGLSIRMDFGLLPNTPIDCTIKVSQCGAFKVFNP